MLPLLSPGVLSIGTAYAIAAVFYVGLAIFAKNDHMIKNAAQINTGVAVGNILLQFLVWSSCNSLSCHVSAAYRAAWFTVAGIVMIIISEYLLRNINGTPAENSVPMAEIPSVLPSAPELPNLPPLVPSVPASSVPKANASMKSAALMAQASVRMKNSIKSPKPSTNPYTVSRPDVVRLRKRVYQRVPNQI